ncbi:MAG: aldehyde dehydrogenase EutE [Spirochaetes bacterium]|nr:aldehyde dehydrogenase EutE [Spirochaetota bacterium]
MDNETLKQIVTEVVASVIDKEHHQGFSSSDSYGVFSDIDTAVKEASLSQAELLKLSLEKRARIIEAIRQCALSHDEEFARVTFEETGMGRYEDKITKVHIAATRTPGLEDLKTDSFSGDHGLTIEERSPYGVIGSVTPSTHPVPTLINNAISMISAGNSVVFNPHPASKKVFQYAVVLFNRAVEKCGGPVNLMTCVTEPTIQTAQAMFAHPDIDLLVITGGPGVVKEAMKYEKRVIGAGPGNPPVIVDESADMKKAAKSIVDGATFDNNIFCTSEKEIFVLECVYEKLKQELLHYHSYELSPSQIDQLTRVAITDNTGEHPVMNRELVGRNASVLANAINLKIDDSIRLLTGEVEENHIFVRAEQLMPFMPIVRVKDIDQAIDLAIKHEHGFHHTAVMHSLNLDHLDQMAKRSKVTIFVKNGPSIAGLGVGGQGTTTFTIAGTTGEGITTARTFTRMRRCVLVDHFRIV